MLQGNLILGIFTLFRVNYAEKIHKIFFLLLWTINNAKKASRGLFMYLNQSMLPHLIGNIKGFFVKKSIRATITVKNSDKKSK
jgi:hypothetical protein